MRKIKVGIIQQSNTADIKANLMNLAKSIEACAAHGAQLLCSRSCTIHFISARQKTLTCLILPNQFPGLPQAFIPSWQQLMK